MITSAPPTSSFHTGYLDEALDNLGAVVSIAEYNLKDLNFDTLVGTGFSGALVVPTLALAMGKNFVLVRKENDGSHHNGRLIGHLGRRWVFVDDFSASGATRERVLTQVAEMSGARHYPTEYIGDYFYSNRRGAGFKPRHQYGVIDEWGW